ncbi:MAG: thiamine phosphate synthase [Terriglobales bacterium]
MAARCLLYYISDRSQFHGDEPARRRTLLDKIAEATHAGVDYIQLREKDLSTAELERLARQAVGAVREAALREARPASGNSQLATRLLINSRTDVALAVGADGVHLRSDDTSVSIVQSIWTEASSGSSRLAARSPLLAVSCHSVSDVFRAESEGADFAVFAPVFEKKAVPGTHPQGLSALGEACKARIPILALGGITLENAAACVTAGAVGIAGIRLFQENRISGVVRALHAL